MTLRVVFATARASAVMPGGWTQPIQLGQHWPADDPVVKAHPSLFSDDPRYGISTSVPIDLSDPPGEVESATARPGERRNVRRDRVS